MKLDYWIVAVLLMNCMTLAASSQDQVALSIYVHEGNINGTMLSGVKVTAQDAEGNKLEGATDSDGLVVLKGQPGSRGFTFTKDGYETLSLNYDAMQTEEVDAYLEKVVSADQIELTIYVHEGDLNGAMLSNVQITGRDAAGSEFSGITDSDGAAVVKGTPGSWEFYFEKAGYESLYLNYDAIQTEEADAYLEKES
jgi:phosphatidate phosphatase APP1